MGRIRTIKPEFWNHEELSACTLPAHFMAAALINYADDEGFFNANQKLIQGACCQLREDSVSIHGVLIELSNIGYIRLGDGEDGRKYGHIINFKKHQKINRPTKSKIAGLSITWKQDNQTHGVLSESSVSPHDTNREQGTGNREHEVKEKYIQKEKIESEKSEPKPRTRKTIPPTLEEVQAYILTRPNCTVDASHFMDHYTANGWMRNKTKVKDWQATLRTWERNNYDQQNNRNTRAAISEEIMRSAKESAARLGELNFCQHERDISQPMGQQLPIPRTTQ